MGLRGEKEILMEVTEDSAVKDFLEILEVWSEGRAGDKTFDDASIEVLRLQRSAQLKRSKGHIVGL